MARVSLLLASIVLAFCYLTSYPPVAHAARIVGVFPSPSKSHMLIHCAIADTLARAGHNVTVIGAMPNVYKQAKYRYVLVDAGAFQPSMMAEMINKPKPFYQRFGSLLGMMGASANESLSHSTMQQFLREHGEGSFDLMILGYFLNDFVLGLGGHFRCPIVVSFMIQPIGSINKMLGNPNELAYVPTIFIALKQPMNFIGRVKNFLAGMFEEFVLSALLKRTTNDYYA